MGKGSFKKRKSVGLRQLEWGKVVLRRERVWKDSIKIGRVGKGNYKTGGIGIKMKGKDEEKELREIRQMQGGCEWG